MWANILSKMTPIIKAFIPYITLKKTCFLVPLEFGIFLVLFGTNSFTLHLDSGGRAFSLWKLLKKNIKILE